MAKTSYELTFAICALILFIFITIKKERMNLLQQKDKMHAAVCETAGQFTYQVKKLIKNLVSILVKKLKETERV
ncbi:MAG: hypothetical protein K6D97_00670 [Clostridia bacterium]|nr:hypothetical protein [Clostridia bacterium]